MNFRNSFQTFLIFSFVALSFATTDIDTDCGKPSCPVACAHDPCEYDEAGMCIEATYHPNGCDQCQSGYFKKDYNYPCTQCQEKFGDDCVHCTDFLGCQQCSIGTRTFDPECGLYYCHKNTGECSPSQSASESESSESSTDSNARISNEALMTPSPTEEPTEEPMEFESTNIGFGPCGSGTSGNGDDINGYFSVDSLSNTDYDYLKGTYTYSGRDMPNGSPIYALDNGDHDEVTAYQDAEGAGDFILEYASIDGAIVVYFVLDVDSLIEVAGNNTWDISGDEAGEVKIVITVYDCDGMLLEVNSTEDSCTADCIDVSNFYVNRTTEVGEFLLNELGGVGSVGAFNGRYCFDNDCDYVSNLNSGVSGCYEREAETDDLYAAGLGINGETGKVTFIWDWEGVNYEAEYSIVFEDGDLACNQVIDEFFTSGYINDGIWTFTSDNYQDITDYGDVVDVMPEFDFDDCVGQDFYCGIANGGLNWYSINWFPYAITGLCVVLSLFV